MVGRGSAEEPSAGRGHWSYTKLEGEVPPANCPQGPKPQPSDTAQGQPWSQTDNNQPQKDGNSVTAGQMGPCSLSTEALHPPTPLNTLQRRLKLGPWLLGRRRNGGENKGPEKCSDLPWLPSDYS